MLAGFLFASMIGALAVPEILTRPDEGEGGDAPDDPVPAGGEDNAPEPAVSPDPAEAAEERSEIATEVDAPGTYTVPSFDTETQHLTLGVPEASSGFGAREAAPEAEPPRPASLSFTAPDGEVTLEFDGRDTVPEDALSVEIGTSQPAPLSEVLAEGASEAEVAEPVLPSVLEDEVDGVSWSPAPPELGPAPDDTPDDTDATVSAEPEAPVLPSVIAEEVDGTSWSPAPDDLPDATPEPDSADETVTATAERDVQVIDGFDPERDVLSLPFDGPAGVTTAPSADGLSGEVIVGDRVVARVLGVPELGLDHLAFSG